MRRIDGTRWYTTEEIARRDNVTVQTVLRNVRLGLYGEDNVIPPTQTLISEKAPALIARKAGRPKKG